jgi:hypothetical protein
MKVRLDGHAADVKAPTAYLEHVELNYGSTQIDRARTEIWIKYVCEPNLRLRAMLVEDHVAELYGLDDTERTTCLMHRKRLVRTRYGVMCWGDRHGLHFHNFGIAKEV